MTKKNEVLLMEPGGVAFERNSLEPVPKESLVRLARSWAEIQRKLLRASKTVDAYARGLDDYLRLCA